MLKKLIKWLNKKDLEYLCWRKALIKATCVHCGEEKPCGNVPDLGWMCIECQNATYNFNQRE